MRVSNDLEQILVPQQDASFISHVYFAAFTAGESIPEIRGEPIDAGFPGRMQDGIPQANPVEDSSGIGPISVNCDDGSLPDRSSNPSIENFAGWSIV